MSIWTKYDYKLVDFGGVDNCAKCDQFTHVWEFDRSDGAVVALCEVCRDEIIRREPIKLSCDYGHRYIEADKTSIGGCPECFAAYLEKGGSLD
jgi:hypothetical protein